MIALEAVSKSYRTRRGRQIVLEDASAVFPTGHNFGVLGVNGSGKSTLIRLLAGTELPDRGVIRRDARVSFPLGFGGTFHGALSRYSGADGTNFFTSSVAAIRSPTQLNCRQKSGLLPIQKGFLLSAK
jgi:ABC-type polysaccharide/polyol phosphate transport system ATPase subunit